MVKIFRKGFDNIETEREQRDWKCVFGLKKPSEVVVNNEETQSVFS